MKKLENTFKVKEIKKTKDGELTIFTNGYKKLIGENRKGEIREFGFKPSKAKEVPDHIVKELVTDTIICKFAQKVLGDKYKATLGSEPNSELQEKHDRIVEATREYATAIAKVSIDNQQWSIGGADDGIGSLENIKHDIDYLCDNYLGRHDGNGERNDLKNLISDENRKWLKEKLMEKIEDDLNDGKNERRIARAGL